MTKQLRPYQSDCHEAVIEDYNSEINKILITLFTGAGKTYILIKLLEKMGFKKILWLSFQTELVEQTALSFIKEKYDEKFYNNVKDKGFLEWVKNSNQSNIGCIKGDIFKVDTEVVMGSVMTVKNRLSLLPADYFDCIVCDEAHLFGSVSAVNTINYFTPKLLIGCTATPHRVDGMMLGDIFEKITFEYGLDKGIRDGYAAELDAIRVKTTTSLDKVRTTAGELNQKDLSGEINTPSRNQLIAASWLKYCKGRQTIVFTCDIQHAIDLAETFRDNGINCVAVSSNDELTPDRSENIKRFKAGEIQVITNVNILVAGFDHPDTGCAIMASPTKSLTKYLQAVGRSARLKSPEYVEKFGQRAIILDIVDVTSRHNLINAWELDKQKPVEERTFVSQEKKDLLLAERAKKKLEHTREEDERVNLLSLPKFKISNSIKMQEPATEGQLKWIKDLGYDVINNHYTYKMAAEIISNLPATDKQIYVIKKYGYDISSGVTRKEAELVFKTLKEKGLIKEKE